MTRFYVFRPSFVAPDLPRNGRRKPNPLVALYHWIRGVQV
jgi:hypothetical protein